MRYAVLQLGCVLNGPCTADAVTIPRPQPEEIAKAEDCDMSSLVDKESDDDRVKKKEWCVTCWPSNFVWGGCGCPQLSWCDEHVSRRRANSLFN